MSSMPVASRVWNGATLVALALAFPALGAEPTFSFHNPFHPEQCTMAVRHAQRRLAGVEQTAADRLTLAEGLLCEGLGENPWALRQAIQLLDALVTEDRGNFYLFLDRAEAIRKLYPASEEARAAIADAARLLPHVRRQSTRAEIEDALQQNSAAIDQLRAVVSRRLADLGGAEAGTLSARQTQEFITHTRLTGAAGEERGRRAADAFERRQGPSPLVTMARADLAQGTDPPRNVAGAYARAAAELCVPTATVYELEQCSVARGRLAAGSLSIPGHEDAIVEH